MRDWASWAGGRGFAEVVAESVGVVVGMLDKSRFWDWVSVQAHTAPCVPLSRVQNPPYNALASPTPLVQVL